jgi:ADP-ribosylglycohydrolase
MIGAIAGDVVGSVYERQPTKHTTFDLFLPASRFTDDTVLTVATAFSLMGDGDYTTNYRMFGRLFPRAGYGQMFNHWLHAAEPRPYNSWGNGSAMRVCPIGLFLDDENDVLAEAERSAAVTHNHPEGIKGAQAVALGTFLAAQGGDALTIRTELAARFGYDLDRTVDAIRPAYRFEISCQGSVPEAIICFLEADSWEQAVRLAVSLGGDADTQACIAGGIAEAAFGPPEQDVVKKVRSILTRDLRQVVDDFEQALSAG